MKAILIGGGAVNSQLEALLQTIEAPVYHSFGMTETLSHIALRKINGKDRENYFKVLSGVSIDTDNRNCLIITSPFTEAPLITNDIVDIIDDNKFVWLGRADFLINTGGIKVHPEKIEKEIEKIFLSDNIQVRFFITGMQDDQLGQVVTLIMEHQPWSQSQQVEIQNKLLKVINKYELPKQWYYIDKFEETGSGKIDRQNTFKKIKTQYISKKGLPHWISLLNFYILPLIFLIISLQIVSESKPL